MLSALDRTLRITDGIMRFRIIKLKPGVPDAPDVLAVSSEEPAGEPEVVVEAAVAAAVAAEAVVEAAAPAGTEVEVEVQVEPEAEAEPDRGRGRARGRRGGVGRAVPGRSGAGPCNSLYTSCAGVIRSVTWVGPKT